MGNQPTAGPASLSHPFMPLHVPPQPSVPGHASQLPPNPKPTTLLPLPLPWTLTREGCVQAPSRGMDETRMRFTDAQRQERAAQLQRTMALLVHASVCRGPCRSTNCARVKALFTHATNCDRRSQGNCPHCRSALPCNRIVPSSQQLVRVRDHS